ncbi:protein CANDIDATE G-PROTEIN COUPLED RECEPTOR 7, partial [Eucalyptus grandis]|uniref:protein CANDIDATE G-PROTEIN COUPLED RECEPTOR 7 n=1 Tax=Eucalyptus grandis TaxID=71139 RepID=UPI00192F0A4F
CPSLLLLLLLPLLASLLISPATAEIKTLTISDDSRPLILFEKFGFTRRGNASISVSAVNVASATATATATVDSSRLGFFLLSDEAYLQILQEAQQSPDFCVLDSKYIFFLFNFHDLSPPPHASFNKSYAVVYPNEYSLAFANCLAGASVSMKVRTELFNLEAHDSKDYLSAGLTQLPSLYFVFSLCYFGFLGFWIYYCYHNKRSVHRIHLLMAALLLMKALNLICAAEDKHYVKVTGTPHGWDVLFYMFQFIRVVLLFTVIVLIGTGWSFLKPFLQEKEKKVLMIVIPLQVLANVASVVLGETGPFIKDWETWQQVFLLVDIICCCAIIFPIVWSIRSLRETSKTDGKAARNLAKLQLFRQFYVVVIGYLYFTRIVVYALGTIAAYKYKWVSNAAEEIASLAFYIVMFYMFRPLERNEYFVLDEEEEKEAELALRDEEFDL